MVFAPVVVKAPVMVGAKLDAMQDHTMSHGKGTFTATVSGGKLHFTLKFSGLTGGATAAHIHVGAKGKSGNVLVPLCGPCKADEMGSVKLDAMQLHDIEKGATYVNVHTKKYPNGEIRGQLAVH
ncbi:MAG: CHRD domain-containing protein [Actinomycetota bacterium]